jgi:hypothetical protein
MLGDILGLRAGLTRLDGAMLFLFFVPRQSLESVLLTLPTEKAGLVGDETALSIGLGLPYSAAPAEGVLNGVNLGVFRAVSRGVS